MPYNFHSIPSNRAKTSQEDWLNPIAMDKLVQAVMAEQKTVVLNGVDFYIDYTKRRDAIYLQRIDGGFAPQGTIPLHRIRSFDFEASP